MATGKKPHYVLRISSEVDLGKSVHVSSDQGIYAYDAYFIVCAQKLHAPLLSLDKGLKEAAKQAGIRLLEVA